MSHEALEFVDTHCHIQFPDYPLKTDEVLAEAANAGVTTMIAVGCTLPDSQAAVEFAGRHKGVWASVGLHPHEGARYVHDSHSLQQFRDLIANHKKAENLDSTGNRTIIAIGETGLDYYYENSPKHDQKKLLRLQLDLAAEYDLPLIFHVRDAFEDFWPIYDEYDGLKGVVHSFTSGLKDMEQIMSRGLYIGLNGIMTFTKKTDQLEAAKKIPLSNLLLETDAPYLTPVPFRGTICEPKHVRTVGEFLAGLRGESLEDLATITTSNARKLFNIL